MTKERDDWFERVLMSQDEAEAEVLIFTGTCQKCGAYWDVRKVRVCPCGGEVL